MKPSRAVMAGSLGLAGLLLAAGLAIDARATLAAYLVAWIALGAIPIGALGVLMTSYLVRRQWTEALHPVLLATTLTLPAVAICLLPLLLGMKQVYPAAAHLASLSPFKSVYLAPWFFATRSLIYFAIWSALALWLHAAWRDLTAMTRSASAGLIIYALTVSLAGVDWLESLEPDFHSSIYGLLYLGFALLNGYAFTLACSLLTGRNIGQRAGYGALLLSMILLWGYLHAMQYIVIWSGNIPDEAVWYIKRSEHGWQYVLLVLGIGQFVFPFFALLSRRVRADRRWLFALSGLTLVMRVAEASVLILPAKEHVAPLAIVLTLLSAVVFLSALFWYAFNYALDQDVHLSLFVQRARGAARQQRKEPRRSS
jgi:hypothetical protein